ncbi:hypothetical protein [Leifsonia xyli]|uniref:hypothetical protein n=1 Tax=Leifsonia xyli TaxID=1575 RepID=UPI0003F890A8|nr:hypothetical protein [Leifsonia xyli]
MTLSRRGIIAAIAAAAAAVLIMLPSHTPEMATAIAAVGVVVLPAAWGARRNRRPEEPGHVLHRTGWVWAVLAVLACVWELTSYMLGQWTAAGEAGHPTISALVEPLLSTEPSRVLLVTGWVAAGAMLVAHGGSR